MVIKDGASKVSFAFWCVISLWSEQIWAGNPAKFLRELKDDEGAFIPKSADNYSELAAAHAEANAKSFHDLTTVQEVKTEEVKTEEKAPELTTQATQ
jgi:hypothetical protein